LRFIENSFRQTSVDAGQVVGERCVATAPAHGNTVPRFLTFAPRRHGKTPTHSSRENARFPAARGKDFFTIFRGSQTTN
jgi:hypothetical protein